MKKLLTILAIGICSLASAQTTPQVIIPGSYLSSINRGKFDLFLIDSVLLQDKTALIMRFEDKLRVQGYRFRSANFIYAPKSGTAEIVKLRRDTFNTAVLRIIHNVKVGDRLILDLIKYSNGSTTITLAPFACEIVRSHRYTENYCRSSLIEIAEHKDTSLGYKSYESATEYFEYAPYFQYFISTIEGEMTGEVNYFNKDSMLIAKAVFKDDKLVSKEYYWPSKTIQRTRSEIKYEYGFHFQYFYDEEGYLIAKGPVKFHPQPFLMDFKPIGLNLKKLPVQDLTTEYRPTGYWKFYNKKGKIILDGSLIFTEWDVQSKVNREWKSYPLGKPKRKWRPLITPSF